MEIKLSINSHNGTLLKDTIVQMPSLPRVGELVSLKEKLDGTYDFIVYDVRYEESQNFMPILHCESFHNPAFGGESRSFHLAQADWFPNCDDKHQDKTGK
jgi:hypothetical protein